MILEHVSFVLPEGSAREQILADARHVVEKWRAEPDLLRKHFIWDGGRGCGGIYVWKNRAAAERAHDAAWRRMVAERTSGPEPTIAYYDCFMIIDNEKGEVNEYPAG